MPSICISEYDKILLTGDFNTNESHVAMKNFLELFNLTNLVKENTCFKSIDNPSCIDLFITNSTQSFLHTSAITTGVSDFQKMIITVLRFRFEKAKPREIIYRSYQHFNHDNFEWDLMFSMNSLGRSYESSKESVINTLNKHAPLKKRLFVLMRFLT